MVLTVRIAGLVVIVVAALIQLGASATYGELAAASSLPHAIAGDWALRDALALGLDRLPALREPLARAAVARGDDADAERLLAQLGNDPDADDLRGRLAQARGDRAAALHWFSQAGDFVAAQAGIDALAERDPVEALAVIRGFDRELGAGAAAPEIAAEVDWREGQIAAAAAYAHPAERARYDAQALDAYRRALARAPNEETYLLAFGYQALVVGQPAASEGAYRAAVRVVPDSVDAYVGLAAAAAARGECASARDAYARAVAFAADQRRPADIGASYSSLIRAALARCIV
jgi:tetratricopeptide (TPR) repeat protein